MVEADEVKPAAEKRLTRKFATPVFSNSLHFLDVSVNLDQGGFAPDPSERVHLGSRISSRPHVTIMTHHVIGIILQSLLLLNVNVRTAAKRRESGLSDNYNWNPVDYRLSVLV